MSYSSNAKIHIGTSGWSYGEWADGVFYPEDLREKEWLAYYSRHFSTVEINATFYHQMSVKTFAKWRQITPCNALYKDRRYYLSTSPDTRLNSHISIIRENTNIILRQFILRNKISKIQEF